MERKTTKNGKIVIVDAQQIMNGFGRPDYKQLFANLEQEFEEVVVIAPALNELNWRMVNVIAMHGVQPRICVGDNPDADIAISILKIAQKTKDIQEICLLSGDKDFYSALKMVKEMGVRIKIILPFDNESSILKSIADESASIREYAEIYKGNNHQNSNLTCVDMLTTVAKSGISEIEVGK